MISSSQDEPGSMIESVDDVPLVHSTPLDLYVVSLIHRTEIYLTTS